MSSEPEKVWVEVEGIGLSLTNLGKELYPGFSKGEIIDYYVKVAPVMLPHLRGRPATRTRYPNGVGGQSFFEKNAPRHTPGWVRTERVHSPGSTRGRETVEYVVIDDLPTLVWCANLAALELHVPQWRVDPAGGAPGPGGGAGDTTGRGAGDTARSAPGRGPGRGAGDADLLVFDLDPGAPAALVECCRVGLLLRDALAGDGLDSYPKTSGKKGLQLYVPIVPTSDARTSAYARQLARRLERDHPGLVVSRMAKRERTGKVFIDWSQNNAAKTTIAPYSLRATPEPAVSTPVGWSEVEAGTTAAGEAGLRFTAPDVVDRVERDGDLFAGLLRDPGDRRPVPDTRS